MGVAWHSCITHQIYQNLQVCKSIWIICKFSFFPIKKYAQFRLFKRKNSLWILLYSIWNKRDVKEWTNIEPRNSCRNTQYYLFGAILTLNNFDENYLKRIMRNFFVHFRHIYSSNSDCFLDATLHFFSLGGSFSKHLKTLYSCCIL